MSEQELQRIAEDSAMIINGYAFTKRSDSISILNLNHPERAMLLSREGKMLETNMEPIEQALVLKYWEKNALFMEDEDA